MTNDSYMSYQSNNMLHVCVLAVQSMQHNEMRSSNAFAIRHRPGAAGHSLACAPGSSGRCRRRGGIQDGREDTLRYVLQYGVQQQRLCGCCNGIFKARSFDGAAVDTQVVVRQQLLVQVGR